MDKQYITKFSGQDMDEAFTKSLGFDPSSVGVKKISSTAVSPCDLNSQTAVGLYVTDYIIHGPVGLGSISPIQFEVYTVTTSGSTLLAQTITMADTTATRTSNNGGSDWTDWNVVSKEQFVRTSGDLSNGYCVLFNVTSASAIVADKAKLTLQLHAPTAASAKISVNGSSPYKVYNSKGTELSNGDFVTNSYLMVIFTGIPWNADNSNASSVGAFYVVGSPSLSNDAQTIIDESSNRFHSTTGYDASGENTDWYDIDQLSVGSSRVTVTMDHTTASKAPRRVVMSNMTLAQANAIAKLAASKVIVSDSNGLPSTTATGSIESKYIQAIKDISASTGKITYVDSNGLVKASQLDEAKLSGLQTVLTNRILTTNDAGAIADSGVPLAKLTAIGKLANSVAIVTGATGEQASSTTTAAEIKALGDLAYSKVVVSDDAGKVVSSTMTAAQLITALLYNTQNAVAIPALPNLKT